MARIDHWGANHKAPFIKKGMAVTEKQKLEQTRKELERIQKLISALLKKIGSSP